VSLWNRHSRFSPKKGIRFLGFFLESQKSWLSLLRWLDRFDVVWGFFYARQFRLFAFYSPRNFQFSSYADFEREWQQWLVGKLWARGYLVMRQFSLSMREHIWVYPTGFVFPPLFLILDLAFSYKLYAASIWGSTGPIILACRFVGFGYVLRRYSRRDSERSCPVHLASKPSALAVD